MKDQRQTVREALEAAAHIGPNTSLPRIEGLAQRALTALDLVEAMAVSQEPVAWMYDWLPAGGPTAYDWISGSKDEVFAPENCYFNIRPLYAAPVAQQPQAEPLCEDEGCPHSGTKHVCISPPQAEAVPIHRECATFPPEERCKQCRPKQAEAQDVGQLEYRGNSVSYIHQKMTAYRSAIDAAWQAMREAGHPPDGRTPLEQAITKALAPQQAEAVPPGYVLVPVEPTAGMYKAAADAWLDCGSRLVLNKAGAAVRAALAAAPKGQP